MQNSSNVEHNSTKKAWISDWHQLCRVVLYIASTLYSLALAYSNSSVLIKTKKLKIENEKKNHKSILEGDVFVEERLPRKLL